MTCSIIIKILLLIMIPLTFIWILSIIWTITKFRPFKHLCHDIFGWHEPNDDNENCFDGCSFHNTCKYCGKEIMQDSQGNWF